MSSHLLILSDLHLGRPDRAAWSADALRPLWQDAGHLVINGDLAEVHHPDYRAQAAREVLRMCELCAEDGVRLTLISGNHDAHLTDLRHLVLRGGRLLITHGDGLHPSIAPWSPDAATLRAAHDAALASLPNPDRATLEERLSVAQHAAHQEWLDKEDDGDSSLWDLLRSPSCLARVVQAWRRYPALANAFAERYVPSSEVMVIGHTHRAGMWTIDGRVIMNTGSFGWPGKPHAVMVDTDTVSLWPIVHACTGAERHYALGSAPRAMVHFSAGDDENTAVDSARPTTGAMT